MNANKCFAIHVLPDLEMYGGDTVSWGVKMIRDDGSKFSVDTASECNVTLTFTPLKATTGLGSNANALSPLLIKVGEIELDKEDNYSIVVFYFTQEDTKGLRGKYLYQIEVEHDGDLRLCQGYIYIKQNINR